MRERPVARLSAALEGTNPNSSAAVETFSCVRRETEPRPDRALDAVDFDTPASFATSASVLTRIRLDEGRTIASKFTRASRGSQRESLSRNALAAYEKKALATRKSNSESMSIDLSTGTSNPPIFPSHIDCEFRTKSARMQYADGTISQVESASCRR